ncbi:beta-ketoacyl-[acyl-carrier-protein] synthase II, partial [Anaerostipes caccae]|uniref:beta-ketoacyl synthase N-terminal-like domain-containing protein n=1 Tax=Anaerostipes caccae TaxID=105841 RepID=UPI0027D2A418
VGSGTGSLQIVEKNTEVIRTKGPNRVKPLVVPMMISNMAAGNVSLAFGLRGKSINVVTACATGTQSIGEAFRSIQCGEADVMQASVPPATITSAS